MWPFIVGLIAGGFVVVILTGGFAEHPSDREQRLLQARGLAGQVFLVEPAPEPWLRCACLDGMPASLQVYGGKKANGVCCVRCARSELTNWLLHQESVSSKNPADKVTAAI